MIKLISFVIILAVHKSIGERSFTLVLDTTVSMREEYFIIRANMGQVVNAVNRSDFGNFVLVSFKDTVIETPFTTQSADEFTSRLSSLTLSGGFDCPENSLAGIEAALMASGKQSSIFLFTDAYAKDYTNFRAVETLCRDTHSQVIIFLSGYCIPSETSQTTKVDVYYDVARACSGAVFEVDLLELRQAFRFMNEITKTDWTSVTPYEKFNNYQEFSVEVDSFTTDFMIVVSGTSPAFEVVGADPNAGLEWDTIVRTQHSLVVRLTRPKSASYTVHIRGRGTTSATFYKRINVPFEFGFAPQSPRSMKETSTRPIAGVTKYLMINVDNSIELSSVEWLNLGDSVKQVLLLKRQSSGYVTSVVVQTGQMFRFWIIGSEIYSGRPIKVSSKVLAPQEWNTDMGQNISMLKPDVQILDSELGLVDFGTNLTLACKVYASPNPEISWKDEEHDIDYPSESYPLIWPSVYISYVRISNFKRNSTISCNYNSKLETVSGSIALYVNRTFSFDVIQRPEDVSVEIGTEKSLYCQVDAYPEAIIKWYFNKTLIDNFNTRVSLEEYALVIKNMSFEDVGAYECRASNDVESKIFPAAVLISGVEAPKIEESETKMNFKPGDRIEIECRVKGKPAPEVSWKYRGYDDFDFKYLPNGVFAAGGKVRIQSIEKSLGGVYRCVASNAMGEDTKDFEVKIQYPPVIKNRDRETKTVKEGDDVNLFCEVEATPEATVRWEMSQDDVIRSFDHRHQTDEHHTHHFSALWKDVGYYHCIAENNYGRAERTVILNVLVPPYIEAPRLENVYANNGESVVLECNVMVGNPAPRIKWEFMSKDSTTRTLKRDSSTSSLHLDNISQSNEGSYLCKAENQIGTDRIKYHLIVQ